MIYAMTFFVDIDDPDEMEEWDCCTCRGVEAETPFDAVKSVWDHCWIDDPAMDAERVAEWFAGEDNSYTFHVIGRDGSQWIVSFDVVPVSFIDEPVEGSRHPARRRVIWHERNVKTEPAPPEHAAEYPARWRYFTTSEAEAERLKDEYSMLKEGWWIEIFEKPAEIKTSAL